MHALKRDSETVMGYYERPGADTQNLNHIKNALDYANTQAFITAGADTATLGLGSGISSIQNIYGLNDIVSQGVITGSKVATNAGIYVVAVNEQNKAMSKIDNVDYSKDLSNPNVKKAITRDVAVNSLLVVIPDIIGYQMNTTSINSEIPSFDFSAIPEDVIVAQNNLVDEALMNSNILLDNTFLGAGDFVEELIWKNTYAPEGRQNYGILDLLGAY